MNHEIRTPIKQPGFKESTSFRFFFRGSLGFFNVGTAHDMSQVGAHNSMKTAGVYPTVTNV